MTLPLWRDWYLTSCCLVSQPSRLVTFLQYIEGRVLLLCCFRHLNICISNVSCACVSSAAIPLVHEGLVCSGHSFLPWAMCSAGIVLR